MDNFLIFLYKNIIIFSYLTHSIKIIRNPLTFFSGKFSWKIMIFSYCVSYVLITCSTLINNSTFMEVNIKKGYLVSYYNLQAYLKHIVYNKKAMEEITRGIRSRILNNRRNFAISLILITPLEDEVTVIHLISYNLYKIMS